MTRAARFAVEVEVPHHGPDAVRSWWTSGVPRGVEIHAHFRGPWGIPVRVREVFTVRSDGSWGFVTRAPLGLVVRDSFRALPSSGGGTLVRIECEVSGLLAPLYAPWARRQFARQWREAARECDASSG